MSQHRVQVCIAHSKGWGAGATYCLYSISGSGRGVFSYIGTAGATDIFMGTGGGGGVAPYWIGISTNRQCSHSVAEILMNDGRKC
jgi:hypothetical protein